MGWFIDDFSYAGWKRPPKPPESRWRRRYGGRPVEMEEPTPGLSDEAALGIANQLRARLAMQQSNVPPLGPQARIHPFGEKPERAGVSFFEPAKAVGRAAFGALAFPREEIIKPGLGALWPRKISAEEEKRLRAQGATNLDINRLNYERTNLPSLKPRWSVQTPLGQFPPPLGVKGAAELALDPLSWVGMGAAKPVGAAAKEAMQGAKAYSQAAKRLAPEVGRAIQDVAEVGRPTLGVELGVRVGGKKVIAPTKSIQARIKILNQTIERAKAGKPTRTKLDEIRLAQSELFNLTKPAVAKGAIEPAVPAGQARAVAPITPEGPKLLPSGRFGPSGVTPAPDVIPLPEGPVTGAIRYPTAKGVVAGPPRAAQFGYTPEVSITRRGVEPPVPTRQAWQVQMQPPPTPAEFPTRYGAWQSPEIGVTRPVGYRPTPNQPYRTLAQAAGEVPTPPVGMTPPMQGGARRPPIEPPMAAGAVPPPSSYETALQKLLAALKAAKPVRTRTEGLKHQALQEKAARMAEARQSATGREALIKTKVQMRGQLPEAGHPRFTSLTDALTDADQNALLEHIRQSELPGFTYVNASEALEKVIAGRLPTRGEIQALEGLFGSKLAKELLRKRAIGSKAYDIVGNFAGLLKSLVASADVSAPMRQGVLLASEGSWWKSWGPMLKSWAKKDAADAASNAIVRNRDYNLLRSAGVDLTEYGKVGPRLAQREEAFASAWAKHISWVNRSERAYVTFLNKLRADTFYHYIEKWRVQGLSEAEILDHSVPLAKFINKATGRGEVARVLHGTGAEILNMAFFAPKFVASRFQVPWEVFNSDPLVRKIAIKNIVTALGTGATALALVKMAGAKVELDPRSTDFGKGRWGNTRIDFWGGFQPLVRYTAQFLTAQRKSASGQIETTQRLDVTTRLILSKLSPVGSIAAEAVQGRTFTGDRLEISPEFGAKEAYNRLLPMVAQDFIDAARVEGLLAGVMVFPLAVTGMTVQSYEGQYNAWMAKYPETVRLNVGYGQVSDKIGDRQLTPQEREQLQGETNRLADAAIQDMLSQPFYSGANDKAKKAFLEGALDTARARARMIFLGGQGVPQQVPMQQQQWAPGSVPVGTKAGSDLKARVKQRAGATR